MLKQYCFLWLAVLLLVGCTATPTRGPAATPETPPAGTTPLPVPSPATTIPITDDSGTVIATQPGPLWVLLSGVDEHGLFAEHELTLLTEPAAAAAPGPPVHSGVAAFVYEIRQSGPQNLRRFYRVQALSGPSGWLSDFYVRRLAYVYTGQGQSVPLYQTPGGPLLTELASVSPVILKNPVQASWWQVATADGELVGWVTADVVKESPELEFLLNQQHEH
ncbi:MAG: hypothetical protein L0346_00255 [Chloroflexi bacterium]|nr:hypothetical protein [Chloroflexota bacterium]